MGKVKSKLERKAELKATYDVYINAWGGYADEPKEKKIVTLIEQIAIGLDIRPSFFYTIAVGEGLGKLYLDFDFNYTNNQLITDKAVNGFQTLGLDFFSAPEEFNRFKKYLPNDYNIHDEYEPYMAERNERNGKEIVPSAKFKDLESALKGFGAVLAHRRDLFVRYRKQYGLPAPSEDEKAYWMYYFFQAENDAKLLLSQNKSLNIYHSKTRSRKSIHIKALERVAAWRYILHYTIFSN